MSKPENEVIELDQIDVQNNTPTEASSSSTTCVNEPSKRSITDFVREKFTVKENKVRTSSFGVVTFEETMVEQQMAPYIRLDPNSNMEDVLTLLTEYWHLRLPNLIISVTGGADGLDLNQKEKEVCKKIVIDAVLSTGAWLITGGTQYGVMDLVGEAICESACFRDDVKVVALGIATWGVIQNNTILKKQDEIVAYNMKGDKGTDEDAVYSALLEPNHSHFLLVDDGTKSTFGGEIKFRSRLEMKLIKPKSQREEFERSIIYLVIGGGVNTLETISKAVEKNMPVIVIESSGRIADFIAILIIRNIDENRSDVIGKIMVDMFSPNDRDNLETAGYYTSIYRILVKRNLINVFHPSRNSEYDINRAILDSLMKANDENIKVKLLLASAWNKHDIADDILPESELKESSKNAVKEAVLQSIKKDNEEFLLLMQEKGIETGALIDKNDIIRLYIEVLTHPISQVELLLSKRMNLEKVNNTTDETNQTCLSKVGKLISQLLGDDEYNPYKISGSAQSSNGMSDQPSPEVKGKFNLDMFYFAILLNRYKVADLIWKSVDDPIAAALLAYRILKALDEIVQVEAEAELSDALRSQALTYQDRAYDLLSECHERNKNLTHQLLVRSLEKPLQNHTLLSFAESNGLMKFMGHTSCQTKLSEIWRGHMALHTQWWKIAVGIVFPFLFVIGKTKIQFTTRKSIWSSGTEEEDVEDKYKTHKTLDRRLYDVDLCGAHETTAMKDALFYFYSAPVTIFALNTISYIMLLLVFSYFVVVELQENITAVEIFVWLWMTTLLADEMRQLLSEKKPGIWKKAVQWFKTKWNSVDLLMYILFILSIILRTTLTGASFRSARDLYSVTLAVFYLRLLQYFYVSRGIGPKIIMIKKMLLDLLDFLPILLVFMVSVGIMYQANLFPNTQLSWKLLQSVLLIPYRQIFGDIASDYLEGDASSSCVNNDSSLSPNDTSEKCPQQNWIIPLFGAAYLLLTNILLVNLLIAKFSYTFQSVQNNANEVWQFYRYSIVTEYSRRPILPPPFNVIALAYRTTHFVCNRMKEGHNSDGPIGNKSKRLTMLLKSAMNAYREKKKCE